MSTTTTTTRRSFLTGLAGLAGIGALGGGLLAAAAPKPSLAGGTGEVWTYKVTFRSFRYVPEGEDLTSRCHTSLLTRLALL